MNRSFYARFGLAMLVAAVFMLPLVLAGARRALNSNRNDVHDWLPAEYDETKQFQWFLDHFHGEQFVLLSWEGCTLGDQRLRLLTSKLVPSEDVRRQLPEPPLFAHFETGASVLERLTSPPIELPRDEALARLRGSLIGPDNEQTCAVLTLSEEGQKNLRRTIESIYRVAEQECSIPRGAIHMGGPPVDNVAIDVAGEQSLFRLAALAGSIGLVVSWWCLRSMRLISMVFTTGILAAAGSLALVYYSGSSMNAIVLTMPSLVYVAAISGAIHLSNYYRDNVVEHGIEGAPERAVKHALVPLSLATGTTAVGLLTLCYSELVPIKMFGIYSAAGVVLGFVLLLFFLPAAFQMFPLPASKAKSLEPSRLGLPDPFLSPRWRQAAEFIIRRNGWVSAACLAALVFFAFGLPKIDTSVQLMRLFSPGARILEDYAWLEKHLGELVPMEIVLRVDKEKNSQNFLEKLELVSQIEDRVETLPDVGSSLSTVTFAPSLPKPEDYRRGGGINGAFQSLLGVRNAYRTARNVFNQKITEHRDEYLAGDYLADNGKEEMWRVSARVKALGDVNYANFVDQLKEKVEPLLAAAQARGVQGLSVTYTGLVPLVYKAQNSLLDGLIQGFVVDFITVSLVMMVVVRDWSAGPILLLPSIFPAVIIFGLMGWSTLTRWPIVVDIGTVMTPAVALGVTVDDVVHYMLCYRKGLKQGMERGGAVMYAYEALARPMYQSWGVIGLGLSVFAFSPFTPTQRFGYLMISLLTVALVGNLVFLPALLAGPLGALFCRRIRREALQARQGSQPQQSQADEQPRDEPSIHPIRTDSPSHRRPVPSDVHISAARRTGSG